MKNSRKGISFIVLLLIATLMIGGCLKSPSSVIYEGATEFARGKEEETYQFLSADEMMAKMMEDFSGSFGKPKEEDLSEDEGRKIAEEDDDDQKIDISADDKIGSIDELKEVMHQMMVETKEKASFELESGYTFNNIDLLELYDRLTYEDAYDVILVEAVGSVCYDNTGIIELYYAYDVNKVREIKKEERAQVREAKKAFEKEINVDKASEYEIVCAMNEFVSDLIIYPDKDPSYPDGFAPEHHIAYNAFKNGYAVCDGYARTTKLLLNEYGIECGIEVGDCNGLGGHAWNLVKVDGDWYQLDVCWNDTGSMLKGKADDTYLLVTDEFMKQSRTWNEDWYPSTPSKPYTP